MDHHHRQKPHPRGPFRLATITLFSVATGLTLSAQAVDELPENLSNISLDSGLLTTIDDALPESSQVDASFLNPAYDPNLTLSQDAQLAITFVDEGAGYRNSLGYFNFSEGSFDNLTFGDIDSDINGRISVEELDALNGVETGMIFANFSEIGGGGLLSAGDTTVIGDGTASLTADGLQMDGGTVFSAGTTTGFFLMANAWNGSGVQSLDQPGDPNVYFSLDFLNPENDATATLGDVDENARHVSMMFASDASEEVIVGFEDLLRPYGDNDFNDAVFIVRSSPFEAIAANEIPVAMAPAPSPGAGIAGMLLLALGYPLIRIRAQRG